MLCAVCKSPDLGKADQAEYCAALPLGAFTRRTLPAEGIDEGRFAPSPCKSLLPEFANYKVRGSPGDRVLAEIASACLKRWSAARWWTSGTS